MVERPGRGRIRLCPSERVRTSGAASSERFVDEAPDPRIETHSVPIETERAKVAELRRIKDARDGREVRRRLEELVAVARDERADLMPATIAAVKARCTMGEITAALRVPFGTYREQAVF